jgi:hypothetical protein
LASFEHYWKNSVSSSASKKFARTLSMLSMSLKSSKSFNIDLLNNNVNKSFINVDIDENKWPSHISSTYVQSSLNSFASLLKCEAPQAKTVCRDLYLIKS